jgi:hypothetical protein
MPEITASDSFGDFRPEFSSHIRAPEVNPDSGMTAEAKMVGGKWTSTTILVGARERRPSFQGRRIPVPAQHQARPDPSRVCCLS